MRRYKICYAHIYGSKEEQTIELPDGAIVVGKHTLVSEPVQRRRFFGLLPVYDVVPTRVIMYLLPMDEEELGEERRI